MASAKVPDLASNNNYQGMISDEVSNELFMTQRIKNFRFSDFSQNMYTMMAHGESGTPDKLDPIKLKHGEKIIATCIDGCVNYMGVWSIIANITDKANPYRIDPLDYKQRFFEKVKSHFNYGDSLCVFENEIGDIKLYPSPDQKIMILGMDYMNCQY